MRETRESPLRLKKFHQKFIVDIIFQIHCMPKPPVAKPLHLPKSIDFFRILTLGHHTKTLFQVHSGAHSTHNLNDEDAGKSHSRCEFVKQKSTEIFAGELSQTSFTKIVQESVRIFTRNMPTKIATTTKQLQYVNLF